MTDAAQAFANDDIEGADSYIDTVRKRVGETDILSKMEGELERRTLSRLGDRATEMRQKLPRVDLASAEDYFELARTYGLILLLDDEYPLAVDGLKALSDEIALF